MFNTFTLTYNRATKQWECAKVETQYLSVNATAHTFTTGPSNYDIAAALGQLIAGTFGPTKPALRAALAAGLLAALGSTQQVDTTSFSSPIISL